MPQIKSYRVTLVLFEQDEQGNKLTRQTDLLCSCDTLKEAEKERDGIRDQYYFDNQR